MKSKKTAGYQDSEFYFDDCEICKFMEEVEERKKTHAETELKKAFDRQNKKNGSN